MKSHYLSHIEELEAEAIYVIREVMAQFERPAILFSGGKDSILLTYLCRKAFYPARIPFLLIHIDTGHNFPETIEYRDWLVKELELQLIVGSVQESIELGRVKEETGFDASRNALQTVTLLDTIEANKIDAAMGGARRDEEKSRAKERFFSHRNEFGQWDSKNQRPELWNIFNGRKQQGEHFRVFPISNWTELDVWQYLHEKEIPVPKLYFAHQREVIVRDEVILSTSPWLRLKTNEKPVVKRVRFRTCGDMPITGAVESEADTLEKIISEIKVSRKTERGTRADDKRSETAMEDRKKSGYF
jgi:sulfate adenylyltransferase subunit 2